MKYLKIEPFTEDVITVLYNQGIEFSEDKIPYAIYEKDTNIYVGSIVWEEYTDQYSFFNEERQSYSGIILKEIYDFICHKMNERMLN